MEKENFYPNADISVWLRSCPKEIEIPLEGKVIFGRVPLWLSGSLIRNGPGGVDVYGADSYKHAFDAPAFLQKFVISNGIVTYTSKFLKTNTFKINSGAQRLVLSEFGTAAVPDPCQTIFQRCAAVFLHSLNATLTDNANISIHPFGDEIYSLAETPFAHRIDLKTLDTINTVDINKEIGLINHSAHPHIIGKTVYNIGQKLSLRHGAHYVIAQMNTTDQSNNKEYKKGKSHQNNSPWSTAKIVANIPSRWRLNICYMHSFALTQNYFIVIEQPLAIFIPAVPMSQILRDRTLSSCLKFYPEEDTIFHIVPKANKVGGQNEPRRTFTVPSFFFLHTINAFEEKNDQENNCIDMSSKKSVEDSVSIVIDICCYKDPYMIDGMFIDALKDAHSNPNYAQMFRGRPKRFRMRLSDFDNRPNLEAMPSAESNVIVDIGCELPTIYSENYDGQPYKYFYAISSDIDLDNPGTLIKVDAEKGSFKTWCEPRGYPSEPIFVPRPNASDEDDGIIISSVVYGQEKSSGPNKTSLIILNAQTWELITKVEIDCASSIPKCLHGWYFPTTSEKQKCYEHSEKSVT